MARSNSSKCDPVLSKYFEKKINEGIKIPTIVEIEKETGISVSSISRYARKKGFANFAVMKNEIERGDNIEQINDHGLLDFLRNNETFVLAASRSCNIPMLRIGQLLKHTGKEFVYIDELSEGQLNSELSNRAIILITLSGETRVFEKLDVPKYKNKFLITTGEYKSTFKNVARLKDFHYDSRSNYDVFKTEQKLSRWLEDILNIYFIEYLNKRDVKAIY